MTFPTSYNRSNELVVYLNPIEFRDVSYWCKQMYGDSGILRKYRWRAKWSKQNEIISRGNQDIVLFTLRWA